MYQDRLILLSAIGNARDRDRRRETFPVAEMQRRYAPPRPPLTVKTWRASAYYRSAANLACPNHLQMPQTICRGRRSTRPRALNSFLQPEINPAPPTRQLKGLKVKPVNNSVSGGTAIVACAKPRQLFSPLEVATGSASVRWPAAGCNPVSTSCV